MRTQMKAMLVAMSILLKCAAVSAQPGGLYRGSARPPSEVFEQGFVGGGSNANPVDHASGASCGDPALSPPARSAYVALVENLDDALLQGRYVYVVMPDVDAPDETATFNLAHGLRFMATRPVFGLNLRQQSAVENPTMLEAVHGQHMSRRIPREWIYSVSEYSWDTGAPELVGVALNPHYRQPARFGSRETFSDAMVAAIQSAPPPTRVTYATRANGTQVSSCVLDSACGPQEKRTGLLSSGPPPLQCAREPIHARGSRFFQALDMILGN